MTTDRRECSRVQPLLGPDEQRVMTAQQRAAVVSQADVAMDRAAGRKILGNGTESDVQARFDASVCEA